MARHWEDPRPPGRLADFSHMARLEPRCQSDLSNRSQVRGEIPGRRERAISRRDVDEHNDLKKAQDRRMAQLILVVMIAELFANVSFFPGTITIIIKGFPTGPPMDQ